MSSKEDARDFLMKMVELNGVACSTVKDGHILIFNTSWLKNFLEAHKDKEQLSIFVKRPDFNSKTGN